MVSFFKRHASAGASFAKKQLSYVKHICKSSYLYIYDFLRPIGLVVICATVSAFVFWGFDLSGPRPGKVFSANLLFAYLFACFTGTLFAFVYLRSSKHLQLDDIGKAGSETTLKSVGIVLTAVGLTIGIVTQTKSERQIEVIQDQTKLARVAAEYSDGRSQLVGRKLLISEMCEDFEAATQSLNFIKDSRFLGDKQEIGFDEKELVSSIEKLEVRSNICNFILREAIDTEATSASCEEIRIGAFNTSSTISPISMLGCFSTDPIIKDIFTDYASRIELAKVAQENQADLEAQIKVALAELERSTIFGLKDATVTYYIAPMLAFFGIGFELIFLVLFRIKPRERIGMFWPKSDTMQNSYRPCE